MSLKSAGAARRPSAERTIPVRRLEVDLRSVEVDRWIVDDDPIFSHFIATLSAVFPRGEEFFVTTVREHRHVAEADPVLKAQVKGFTGQEAMHGKEHRRLNARLAELGYYTVEADRSIDRACRAILKLRPRTLPLAVTAAAEHLTGVFAEVALGHEPSRELLFSHPDVQALVTWHALEELEHKNVAFDVLERAGAGYVVRAAGFFVLMAGLATSVVGSWMRARLRDRRLIGREGRRRFVEHLGQQRLISLWALRRVLGYLRPGFHPDDTDTDELVREWRERLAGQVTETSTLKRTA
jgi:predicted metal-dependent hydrolase